MAKVKSKKVCKAAESVAEVVIQNQLQVAYHFPCPIYLIERPDFLETVREVSKEALEAQRKIQDMNELYPVVMSTNYYADPRLSKFTEFIGGSSWNILNDQGYSMQDKVVSFSEVWTQEHHKYSSMEQHVHGGSAQIVGFYFLETPENCSRVVIHDPRAGKVQTSIPEQDINMATPASRMINFEPKAGLIIFTNAWLAHSFTRHANEKPIKFVHFTLSVENQIAPICTTSSAEVI